MEKIIKIIGGYYQFPEIINFKRVLGGIMNETYSFRDDKDQKYFVKSYIYYKPKTILKTYKIMDAIRAHIDTNEIVKTKKGDNLLILGDMNIEISEFITDAKTINSLKDLTSMHISEIAKNLALFHKGVENLNINVSFIEIFSFEDETKIFNKIKKEILSKEKNDFNFKCLELINIKLNQIKKFKDKIKINTKKLPTQINHGDFIPQNCFFDKYGKLKYLIDFEHILKTYRIYDVVKTVLYISRNEEYEIPNSGEYDLNKIISFIKEYLRYNKLNSYELKCIPYLILYLSIKSDMVLYGHYMAKNKKVKRLLPKKNLKFYYTWWENNYLSLDKSIKKFI